MCARRSLVFVISQRMAQLIFGSLEFVFMITHSLNLSRVLGKNLNNDDVARKVFAKMLKTNAEIYGVSK